MQVLDSFSTLELLAKLTGKYVIMITFCLDDAPDTKSCFDELQKAAPYLDLIKHGQAIIEEHAYILFDTEEEMMDIYNQTVGDDGPTRLNHYNGPMRVYAITCYPDGQTGTENT